MKLSSRSSIAALGLGLALGVSAVHAAPVNLLVGWNLQGNSSSAAIDVAGTFGDTTKFTTVWKWNRAASKWAFYAPTLSSTALASYALNKGYDVLTSIAPKEGYWVNASAAATLAGSTTAGVTLAASDLQSGWNLMASADNLTPSQLKANLNNSLNAAGKAITTLWAWDTAATQWKFYAPSLEAQGGTVLSSYISSKGYVPFTSALGATEGFWMNLGTVTPTVTPIGAIGDQMNALAGLFAAGPPTQAAVTAKLSPSLLMDGMNATAYAKQLTSAPAAVASGDTFAVSLATLFDNANQTNTDASIQWVNATQFNAAGAVLGESRVKFVNVGGTWLIAGNERAVQVNVRAESSMAAEIAATATAAAVPATFSSDINIAVDPTTAALSGVASAWVSGASIVGPSSGLLVYSNAAPGTAATAIQSGVIPLCDAAIVNNCTNVVDGAEYTITLKDSTGWVIATYQEALKKAPLPATALNAALFPSIGAPTPLTVAAVSPGAAMSLRWNNPAGLVSNWVDFTVWDSNGQLVLQQSGLPSGTTFAGTLPAFVPPAAGSGVALSRFDITIQGVDAYGRQYVVFKTNY